MNAFGYIPPLLQSVIFFLGGTYLLYFFLIRAKPNLKWYNKMPAMSIIFMTYTWATLAFLKYLQVNDAILSRIFVYALGLSVMGYGIGMYLVRKNDSFVNKETMGTLAKSSSKINVYAIVIILIAVILLKLGVLK